MRIHLPKDHHILRLVHRKQHKNLSISRGWQVRIIRRGIVINEYFADRKWGGKLAALSEAMHFRDEKLRELRTIPRSELARRKTVRNTSGIVGVRRIVVRKKRGEKTYEYVAWAAAGSPEPGKRKMRAFYVSDRLDEDAAREAAIAQRLRWERMMEKNERAQLPKSRR